METYEKTFTQHGQKIHADLAKWLNCHVAFISEDSEFLRYAVRHGNEAYLVGITVDLVMKMVSVSLLDENLEPAGIATVHLYGQTKNGAPVYDQVNAAVKMLKGFC